MAMVGNKVTEKDLREYLTATGYYGRSAKFSRLKLVAVERPGWLQVFDFHVQAKTTEGEWKEHFGLCRTDERHDLFEVQLFDTIAAQQQAFRSDTKELITGDRGPRHWVHAPLMVVFLLAMAVAVIGAVLNALR